LLLLDVLLNEGESDLDPLAVHSAILFPVTLPTRGVLTIDESTAVGDMREDDCVEIPSIPLLFLMGAVLADEFVDVSLLLFVFSNEISPV
jgi:hypothetical protein